MSNSSVLIALSQIGRLELLRQLFGQIRIPPAVRQETRRSIDPVDWILETSLKQNIGPPILQASLGDGESEAIGLALELRARLVLLDDLPARRLAESLGLPVTGTVGVLLTAKRQGHLATIRDCLDALERHDFWLSENLRNHILTEAGEDAA